MTKNRPKTKKRKVEFSTRTATQIWYEIPNEQNPYLPDHCYCHGYNLLELMQKCSFIEVLYLIFRGELPTAEQAKLLETLMIGLMNPGPRHPATRAAMTAGVGRTNTAHILPISLAVLGGNHLGANEVTASMRFVMEHLTTAPHTVAKGLLQKSAPPNEGDWHIVPGFGSRFGDIDPLPQKIASMCTALSTNGESIEWGNSFVTALKPQKLGWLSTGICAVVLHDLGFNPWEAGCLFQLINSPGILAHGLEMANKPITAMPFLDEDHYVIDVEARTKKN